MAPDVTRYLATAGRVTDERDVPQIERFDHGRKIVSVAIHIVARRCLVRPAVTSPVMCHDAEALLSEKMHLTVPRVRIQRPTVGEGDDRTSTPVFEIDLCSVFAADRVHRVSPLSLCL